MNNPDTIRLRQRRFSSRIYLPTPRLRQDGFSGALAKENFGEQVLLRYSYKAGSLQILGIGGIGILFSIN